MKINDQIPALAFTCNYHLGDNYGIFPDATYVGHFLTLPVKKTWIDETQATVSLIFETHDIETWADWQGHEVKINTTIVGCLKDSNANQYGNSEQIIIEIPMAAFIAALEGKDDFYLTIVLGRQAASPGLSDDFAWTRLDTFNCGIQMSWK